MRDGAAERRLARRALGIDMDELVVVGGVGELVDHRLRHDAPRRHADLGADGGLQLIERDRLHLHIPSGLRPLTP